MYQHYYDGITHLIMCSASGEAGKETLLSSLLVSVIWLFWRFCEGSVFVHSKMLFLIFSWQDRASSAIWTFCFRDTTSLPHLIRPITKSKTQKLLVIIKLKCGLRSVMTKTLGVSSRIVSLNAKNAKKCRLLEEPKREKLAVRSG